ncbi:MAG: DUF5685 family protein [Bacillota bacterium]|nr:DUF5685 family protein [Bacillota bacterium]
MFGYILPEKQELKVKEYEIFRAYYCGLCKAIGLRSGQLKRFLLNYDTAFLALFLSALSDEDMHVCPERCAAHPLKKRLTAKKNQSIEYASDINVLLAYYNLKDNWKDDKSLLSGSAVLTLAACHKKLKKEHLQKCDIIEKRLEELSGLEKEKCSSMDRAAEPFARLMEEIFAFKPLCTDDKTEKILRWIGYNIGKWVYIVDAFDDIEKDIKKDSYNPLVLQYNYDGGNAEEFKIRIREKVEFNLTYALAEIAKAFELLDIKRNKGLVENIIYMGMLRKTEQILKIGVV